MVNVFCRGVFVSGRLIIMHGLPGSGKSTIARGIAEKDPHNTVIVERNELRTMMFGAKYHTHTPDKKSEQQVTHVQQDLIKKGLEAGKTVINSDTNLNPRFLSQMFQIADKYHADVEQKYVDVPVDVAKERNRLRGEKGERFVPENIIDSMAERAYDDEGHLKEFVVGKNNNVFAVSHHTKGSRIIDEFNEELSKMNPMLNKTVVVLDMDGTLFDNHSDSVKFLKNGGKKDFPAFYRAIADAPVNEDVRNLVNKMRSDDNLNIVAVTGRSDDYAGFLVDAIRRSGANISRLIMKRQGDMRSSSFHKADTVKKLRQEGYIICHAIDDRTEDLEMFNRSGIATSVVSVPLLNDDGSYDKPVVNTTYGAGHCIRCGSKLKDPTKNIGSKCATKQ